jgi:hypothetical protein
MSTLACRDIYSFLWYFFQKCLTFFFMNLFFIVSAVLAAICVLAALGLGLFSMAKGGEFNKAHGNKIMQARVVLQGLALAMLALAYFSSQG